MLISTSCRRAALNMGETIPKLLESRKVRDIVLVAVVMLVGLISFGLGRLSLEPQAAASVLICSPETPQNTKVASGVARSGAAPGEAVAPEESGTLVGSKNGSVYHYPWCSGAGRIKEENKVWFKSKADAEQAGYRPAQNCKGL